MAQILSDHIVELVFTPEEIAELREVYDEEKFIYLGSLELDPFAYDHTTDMVKDKVKEFLKSKDLEAQESELNDLTKQVEYYCI